MWYLSSNMNCILKYRDYNYKDLIFNKKKNNNADKSKNYILHGLGCCVQPKPKDPAEREQTRVS